MVTKIFNNYCEFQQRLDKSVNGVNQKIASKYPDYAEKNGSNVGCWNCVNCTDCRDCINCTDCHGCFKCNDCKLCWDCESCVECRDLDDCIDVWD